jgi:hypothetical protein
MTKREFTPSDACRSDGVPRVLCTLVASLGLGLLVACSGKGGTNQFVSAPTVIATPIGYKPTSAPGANPVTITVRAGADVQLTGEDSYGGNTSITSFGWQQTDAAPVPSVGLIYRNSSTVSFTAPYVAQSTLLNFQLTVVNALGLKGTATVQVTVAPANDPNRFLTLLAAPHAIPHHFRVALSLATANANPGDAVSLASDAPVCVILTPTLSYLNRSAATNSVPLAVQQIDAKWLASAGATAGFPTNPPAYLAFRNPVVSFDLPTRNDEVLFAQYNQPGASAADIANQLVPSDIDSAYVKMAVSASPGSCDGSQSATALTGAQLMIQLQDELGDPIGPSATGATGASVSIDTSLNAALNPNPLTPDASNHLTPEDVLRASALTTANAAIETRESAAAYYAAINPPSATQKSTLTAWLSQNCFDPNTSTFGAGESGYNVVHATYTNNFDLGFGRDMYFATCANGNMASVVVNYPSLEAAANKLGAFLAVAMEYTPVAGSSAPCFGNVADPKTNTGACFTKFYAFAPDDRTGEFKRVLSANFDRRGQKYLPGACTVCHGGTPDFTPGAAGAPYSSGLHGMGDVDAAFLPWDLGSLLFSDKNTPNSDPAFACSVSTNSTACESINPALYTQAAQAPNIQKLNALAWRTYQSPEMVTVAGVSVDRYAAPIALLTKWYGGDPAAATAYAFDDSATPTDWVISGQTAPTDLYHTVFAHYCRSCHTQNNSPAEQFASFAAFNTLLAPNTSSELSQRLNVQQLVYNNGQMPLARLTADRFWVDFGGGQSAAQTLANFINGAQGAAPVAMDSSQNVVPPGAPAILPLFSSNPSVGTPLLTVGANSLIRFQGASLDALTQSLFVSTYQWSLCSGGAPATLGGACPGAPVGLIGTPAVVAGSGAGAPQSGAALPALSTTAPGTYYLTLTAGSNIIGATLSTTTYQINIPQQDPSLAVSSHCPAAQANFNGTQITVDVTDATQGCFKTLGDAGYVGYSLFVSGDGTNYSNCVNTPSCTNNLNNAAIPWMASVSSGQKTDPATNQNIFVPTITFNFTPAATGNATLYFKWCDGNSGPSSCVEGTATVSLITGLNASAATFLTYWAPTDANYGQGGFSFTPPSSGSAINPPLSLGALNTFISVDAPSATLSLGTLSDGGSFSSATLTGSASSLTTQINSLTYTPGDHFVTCNINGVDLSTGNPCTGQSTSGVTFPYSLSTTGSTVSSTGTINIRALASFQTGTNAIYTTLGNNCTSGSCHASGGAGTNRWTYSGTANSTYNSIQAGVDHTSNTLVKAGDPSHSAFYTAPCTGSDTGLGMPVQFTGSAATAPKTSQCQIIYQWILEGGQLD